MDEETKKKKIAKLYFDTQEAEQGLKRINEWINTLNTNVEKKSKEMQKNFGQAFKLTADKGELSKFAKKYNEAQLDIGKTAAKEAEKRVTAATKAEEQISVIQARETEKRKTINAKLTAAMELENNKREQSTQKSYSRLAGLATTYLSYQGFNAIRKGAEDLVNEMVDVEYSMIQIDRVLNENSLNINNYRDQLIQLAYDYGNSFDAVADATLRLAQAGFSSEEALALTEKTLLALNTAELDATQATDGLVAIMSQWGLMTGDVNEEAESYARIIDEINMTADNFPTTSADILDALKRTSSAFKLSGATMEETIATIVAAEKATQRGGKVIGTAMNSIIQKLKDTKQLATMEAMGLDVYTDSARTEFKSVMEIMGELADKMNALSAAGKQNSVEMQELQSVFTLFRRNIGTSLLGEMAEGGTYEKVINMLGDNGEGSMGYSLRENEKHMKSAKAAQEQFNATLLQLKTSVWDGGAEDVFRGMLSLGTDIISMLNTMVKEFGTLPTTIGAVTLAFTSLQKKMRFEFADGKISFSGEYITNMKQAEKEVMNFQNALNGFTGENIRYSASFKDYINNIGDAEVSLEGYQEYLRKTTMATKAAELATVGLNLALSAGLSIAITVFLKGLNDVLTYEDRIIEKTKELIAENAEKTENIIDERKSVEELIERYKELNAQESTQETREEIRDIQREIKKLVGEENVNLDLVNGNYEKQLDILKEIRKQKLAEEIKSQTYDIRNSDEIIEIRAKENKLLEKREELQNKINSSDPSIAVNQLEYLNQLEEVNKELEVLQEEAKEAEESLDWSELNEKIAEYAVIPFEEGIESLEDYRNAIENINSMPLLPNFHGSLEEQRELMLDMLASDFPEFEDSLNTVGYYSEYASENFSKLTNKIKNLSSEFDMVNKAAEEFNSTGAISASTFKNVVDNGLLEWLDVVNGQMVVNTQHFEEAAEAARIKAEADLKERAAAEILNIVEADLNGTLQETRVAGNDAAAGVSVVTQQVLDSANKFLQGKAAALEFNNALNKLAGKELSNVSGISENAKKQIANVTKELDKELKMINSLSTSVTKASKAGSGAARSSGSGAKAATKTFEEQSAERVKIFKKEIDDLESLEQSWVNKYKKLNLFSTDDLKFITHQRINRFNEYLNQINNLQGISEKDRADLVREYSAKRQEAELEYFDLLKKKLDEQIDALEKANKERIEQIKDEADARIDALKAVEKEEDKLEQEREYREKREELLHGYQGVEYWQQRTGREAQLALAEAQKKLKDLDEDWEEKKKGWTLEDQIKEIEDARDAQIKAIEEAQEKQIQGWKNAYDEQVRLYAETGQIIYDDSVISAGYLYNAYMENFVVPFNERLQDVINQLGAASAEADNVINKMNTIASRGGSPGTVSQQVNSPGSTVQKPIQGPSKTYPSLNDEIKAQEKAINDFRDKMGMTKVKRQIGKFHGGGMVGSSTESLALLRPKEVVLTPEWAAGMNKLVREINTGNFTTSNISNGNDIEVRGNMFNINVDKIKDRQDIDTLTKQIEKILESKFNIRK